MLYIVQLKSADAESSIALKMLKSGHKWKYFQYITVSEAQLYFKGYSVDRHGNIRIPYIGDLNVLGYTTERSTRKNSNRI